MLKNKLPFICWSLIYFKSWVWSKQLIMKRKIETQQNLNDGYFEFYSWNVSLSKITSLVLYLDPHSVETCAVKYLNINFNRKTEFWGGSLWIHDSFTATARPPETLWDWGRACGCPHCLLRTLHRFVANKSWCRRQHSPRESEIAARYVANCFWKLNLLKFSEI